MTTLLIISIVLLVAVWFGLRSKRAAKKPETIDLSPSGAFSSVSIRGPVDACDAAKQMSGERFLATSPPELPLKDCDRKNKCACYFAQFEDRRRDYDRRSPYSVNTGNTGSGTYKEERRQGKDRRSKSR